MTRTRRVPTGFTSPELLVRALRESGLASIELHAEPTALVSWNKKPTGEFAEIIVRRAELGATADDVGFARRADGCFEAVLSDIHAFRFDRRWFEALEARRVQLESLSVPPTPVPELFSMPKARLDATPDRSPPPTVERVKSLPHAPTASERNSPSSGPVPSLPVPPRSDAVSRSAHGADASASSREADLDARTRELLDEILARADRDLRQPLGRASKWILLAAGSAAIVAILTGRGLGGILCVGVVTFMIVVAAAGVRAQRIAQLAVADLLRAFPSAEERQGLVLRYLLALPKSRHARLKGVLKAILDACHTPQRPPPLRVRR